MSWQPTPANRPDGPGTARLFFASCRSMAGVDDGIDTLHRSEPLKEWVRGCRFDGPPAAAFCDYLQFGWYWP